MEKLIGREEEKKLFQEILKSKATELIAIYGRRRVGKTFLIRQVLQKEIVFEFTGTKEANLNNNYPTLVRLLGKQPGMKSYTRSRITGRMRLIYSRIT